MPKHLQEPESERPMVPWWMAVLGIIVLIIIALVIIGVIVTSIPQGDIGWGYFIRRMGP